MSSYEQRMQATYAAATGVGWGAYAGLLLLAAAIVLSLSPANRARAP